MVTTADQQPADTGARRPRDPDVDTFDTRLIRALQLDGRRSITELAVELDASRDKVAARLRHLREQGGLRIVAGLNPIMAGHHVLVHVRVDVDGPVAPVAAGVAALPDTVFVSLASGAFPLVFESRHADLDRLHDAFDIVRELPGVRRLVVSTYSEVLRGFFVGALEREVHLDALDHALIASLQQDGRRSFRALADSVHLSPSAVRSRVERLIDTGVIRIAAIKAGSISRSRLAVGIGISAGGDTERIRQRILASPDIDFAARCHGNFDFIATIVGTSPEHVLRSLDELRALGEVSALESWIHFEVMKEDYTRHLGLVIERNPRQ